MHHYIFFFFFFNDTATTEIYTLSLHDALPISISSAPSTACSSYCACAVALRASSTSGRERVRSEEHTSELQSRPHLVCRLLLEKKNIKSERPQTFAQTRPSVRWQQRPTVPYSD